MPRGKKPAETSDDATDRLPAAVNRLADEIHVLREAIDELRSHFVWAIRNDRLRSVDQTPADSAPPAGPPQLELDDDQAQAIVQAVKDNLQDLASDVEGAVRDGLKEQFADFRDSVDQFSIDVQFAARKIHDKPAAELSDLRETLQGEIVDLRGSLEQFMMEMYDAIGVAVPAAIAEPAAPTPNQPPLRDDGQLIDRHDPEEIPTEPEAATPHQQPAPLTNAEANELEWLSRKALTASATVAHIAQSQREEHPPSQADRQRSLF